MARKIVRNRARCKHCDTTIESRHRHDCVLCDCGRVFLDGGKDYVRYGCRDIDNDIEVLTEYAPE